MAVIPLNSLKDLFDNRLNAYFKEIGKYSRLIVNDHFSILLFILFAFGAFYYQSFYEQLQGMVATEVKWAIIVISLFILGLVHLYGRAIWLTNSADVSYLFARGHEWDSYWLKGSLIGFVLPTILLVVTQALVFPFINLATNWQSHQLVGFMLLGLMLKSITYLDDYLKIYQLQLLKIDDYWFRMTQAFITVVIYFLSFILPAPLHFAVPALICILALIIQCLRLKQRSNQRIYFEYVIESERRRLMRFYQLVSIFADVPHLRPEVLRRQWLDGIIRPISDLNHNRYAYLYIRQLARHTYYSGIWLKVTVFIAVIISITDQFLFLLVIGGIGYVMTIVQLVPMIHSNDNNPFQIIYPNRSSLHIDGFKMVMGMVFSLQTLVYMIVLLLTQMMDIKLLIPIIGWITVGSALIFIYVPWWERRYQIKRSP